MSQSGAPPEPVPPGHGLSIEDWLTGLLARGVAKDLTGRQPQLRDRTRQRANMHQSVGGDVDDFYDRESRTRPDDDQPTGHHHRRVSCLIEIRPAKASGRRPALAGRRRARRPAGTRHLDHERILRDAVARAGDELEGSDLATTFLGPTFTLSELQSVYEAIWDDELDTANFRRSLSSAPFVVGYVVASGERATA